MLRLFSKLRGSTIGATDGELGKLVDLYFDYASWAVRYLVVDTGRWLPGRQVLISPAAADELDEAHVLPVALTQEQVRKSPDVDTALPVSRQRESELARYYGWPVYWAPEPTGWSAGGAVTGGPTPTTAMAPEGGQGGVAQAEPDLNLRSAREVISYHLHARDGDIGHIEDFVVDDWEWVVRYLVANTRSFWPGKAVLIPPQAVRNVEWEERRVAVDLNRDAVKSAPEFDRNSPIHRSYEEHLHDYYGWRRYWTR